MVAADDELSIMSSSVCECASLSSKLESRRYGGGVRNDERMENDLSVSFRRFESTTFLLAEPSAW